MPAKKKIAIINKKTKKTSSLKEKTSKKELDVNKTAVIKTGGKQYLVNEGKIINIEKIHGNFKEGDEIIFDKVLLVDDGKNTTLGTPYIEGAKVKAKILKIGRAKKIVVIKYKAKSRYFKKRGHRQPFFKVEILKIE